MQIVQAASLAALCLVYGALVPLHAQRDLPDQNRGQVGRQQGGPQKGASRKSQQAQQVQRPRRTEQQAVAWQQQRGWLKHGGWRGNKTWQQSRARRWEREHRTWVQRGGYGGYYIPQDRFSLYFGLLSEKCVRLVSP